MQLVLVDLREDLIEAWKTDFQHVEGVTVEQGSIFEVACDALVSPANSYGFMDGGLDLAISEFFGWHVQERLQERIKTIHHGELLVGQAEIVSTNDTQIPYVIAAPTMRVPMVLRQQTVNPYLAMRAILLLVKYGKLNDGRPISEVIKTIAVPGLGTGVGRVPATLCSHQMLEAISDVMFDNFRFPISWYSATVRHDSLYHQ
jgi:O-acetyl-ADP-ribose deacetylase (regulator of RNase III)